MSKNFARLIFCALIAFAWLSSLSAQVKAEDISQSVIERWNADRSAPFDAREINIDDLEWQARPLLIFADSENDPRYREQLALLAERPDALAERDVIVIVDTHPETPSALRERLRPRGFALVIMGKDGQVELRKPAPWDVREISRTIDKMPLRRQEIDDLRFDR